MEKFSLQNLRKLMSISEAYKQLSAEEKDNIEEHIRLNNKPVLMYIYEQLSTELAAHQLSREELARQINRISTNQSEIAQSEIKKYLT